MNEEKHIIAVHLFDNLILLVRNRGLIIRNVIIACMVIFILSFILPYRYIAVTTLLPSADQDKWGMSGVLSEVAAPGLNLGNQPSTRRPINGDAKQPLCKRNGSAEKVQI